MSIHRACLQTKIDALERYIRKLEEVPSSQTTEGMAAAADDKVEKNKKCNNTLLIAYNVFTLMFVNFCVWLST